MNRSRQPVLVLDGEPLSVRDVERVARSGARVELGARGRERLIASREVLHAAMAEAEPLYGVNTGFGSLANVRISADDLRDVQQNLILSHASGVGDPLPIDAVR